MTIYVQETPLHLAAFSGSYHVAKLLIENGADVTVCNCDARTCLDFAIEGEHEDVAMIIVKHKR